MPESRVEMSRWLQSAPPDTAVESAIAAVSSSALAKGDGTMPQSISPPAVGTNPILIHPHGPSEQCKTVCKGGWGVHGHRSADSEEAEAALE